MSDGSFSVSEGISSVRDGIFSVRDDSFSASDIRNSIAEIRILAFLYADCSMIAPMHAAAASDPAVGCSRVCSSVQGTCECDSPISEVRQVWSPV